MDFSVFLIFIISNFAASSPSICCFCNLCFIKNQVSVNIESQRDAVLHFYCTGCVTTKQVPIRHLWRGAKKMFMLNFSYISFCRRLSHTGNWFQKEKESLEQICAIARTAVERSYKILTVKI